MRRDGRREQQSRGESGQRRMISPADVEPQLRFEQSYPDVGNRSLFLNFGDPLDLETSWAPWFDRLEVVDNKCDRRILGDILVLETPGEISTCEVDVAVEFQLISFEFCLEWRLQD